MTLDVHQKSKFFVWSEEQGDRESAIEIEASDHEGAAMEYAENDVDGSIDGTYDNGGAVLCVEDKVGVRKRMHVEVEYDPSFCASEVTDDVPA